jgi:hypothetical protein
MVVAYHLVVMVGDHHLLVAVAYRLMVVGDHLLVMVGDHLMVVGDHLMVAPGWGEGHAVLSAAAARTSRFTGHVAYRTSCVVRRTLVAERTSVGGRTDVVEGIRVSCRDARDLSLKMDCNIYA